MEEICKFTADPLGKINGSLNKSGIANGNNGLTTKSFMPNQCLGTAKTTLWYKIEGILKVLEGHFFINRELYGKNIA